MRVASDSVRIVIIRRSDGKFAVVQEADDETLKLPGGKFEPGESPAQSCARELSEELGLYGLSPTLVTELVNDDAVSKRYIFRLDVEGDELKPTEEIAELFWLDEASVPEGRNKRHMLSAVAAAKTHQ